MDLEVKPNNWILPNRIGFGNYVYNTFHPSKYPKNTVKNSGCECDDTSCDVPSDVISLFPHQRIIKDFVQFDSPYKGLLLYHELGSGKSAASIAASEGYIGKKKVFIMTPASLVQNYINELLKMSKTGLNIKKSWTLIQVNRSDKNVQNILLLKYSISSKFNKKENLLWIPLYDNDIENAVIVKDKVKYSTLQSAEKSKIDDTMLEIISNRYNFVSYNGLTRELVNKLTKEGFDNSFIVIDEVHNFISRVVNGSKLARNLYNKIISANNNKVVLLSGTPIINSPYEISTLVNLIRGNMNVYKLSLLKKSENPTNSKIIEKLIQDNLFQYVDDVSFINGKDKFISLSLITDNYVREKHNDIDIIKQEWWGVDNKILLQKIIASINTIPNISISKLYKTESKLALPNKKEDFDKMFLDLTDVENPIVKNMDLFKRRVLGTLSYFKTSGTEYFPNVSPMNIRYLDMTDQQLSKYAEVREEERKIDDNNRINRHRNNVMEEKSSVYRAFSRMICNFSFPKNIQRSYPNHIKKLLKTEINIQDDEDDENDESKEEKTKKEEMKKVKDVYEKELAKALKELETKDYLSLDNLKNKYSPKYAQMYEDITTSPGTVLIYSQFRNVEGLGIFSKVLEHQGYKEITVKKTPNGYELEDLTVFDKKYDNKRFVIFNSDRTKTNILMNLFNGSYNLLPPTILQQLRDNVENYEDQLYGKLVKIMMITQSGAEGISLKNVRRVLIMEYYWNAVRINQVIGRAVRTCSHEMLPLEHRNVEIFAYIMKLTKKQLEKDFTIRRLDNSLTTDEHILNVATKKENIINSFLTMLKASSFDCIINSTQNEPLKNGYKCYNWPINVNTKELSYTNDIDMDNTILKYRKLQVEKTNKGKVVSRNGNKYVLLDGKLYDYFSYKNSGVLLHANL